MRRKRSLILILKFAWGLALETLSWSILKTCTWESWILIPKFACCLIIWVHDLDFSYNVRFLRVWVTWREREMRVILRSEIEMGWSCTKKCLILVGGGDFAKKITRTLPPAILTVGLVVLHFFAKDLFIMAKIVIGVLQKNY